MVNDAERLCDLDKVVELQISMNKYLVLFVRGVGCDKQLETLAKVHGDKVAKGSNQFMFFCLDWFRARGFKAWIEPNESLNWFGRWLLKSMLGSKAGGRGNEF